MTHLISVDDPAVLTSRGELDREQCLDLLAGGGFGRVVGTDSAMPAVYPISYVLDGQEVIFHTESGSSLAGTAGDVVAFQADQFDAVTGIGWTVLGIGRPYQLVANPATLSPVTLAIPLRRLTGHRLGRRDGIDRPAESAVLSHRPDVLSAVVP
jgi:hypothetical protein